MTQEHPEQPKAELVEELRELVEWWNAYAVNESPSEWDSPNDAIVDCIDDLEEVIKAYE